MKFCHFCHRQKDYENIRRGIDVVSVTTIYLDIHNQNIMSTFNLIFAN